MKPKLPNLELMEYKAKQIAIQKKRCLPFPEFDFIVFHQIWENTCTGFDVKSTGEPVISGCAMTKEYTVVAYERHREIYIIFFGERPCYIVDDPTEEFFEDLKSHQMASLSVSKTRYSRDV